MNEGEDHDRLGEVLAAYLEALDNGWAPDRTGLLARYAELRPDLEAFFAAQDQVNTLAGLLGAEPRERPSLARAVTVGLDGETSGALPSGLPSFGDYEVLGEVARGGMGVVYRARQVSLGRTVALKMILAGPIASPSDVERFRREAEAAALMDHPGIVPIYEVGAHEGRPWFSMKLIEGGSLAEHRERFRTPHAAVRLLVRVARAVHQAHQHGVLHRDLKPANILLGENDEPLVTDFGLAKRFEGDAGLTQSGAIVGTPNYMAPEQASGEMRRLTTATDVHALGAILYELLTGNPPFEAGNVLDTLLKVRQEKPASPRAVNPTVDRDLETICLKCLEKDPARRYGSAELLADDLERWERGEPVRARRTGALERAWKWARRRPGLAVLWGATSAALATAALVTAGYLGAASRLRDTEAERARADKARADAEEEWERADTLLYANRIMRASYEWHDNEVARADQILEECPPARRHWEWRYLKRLCHSEAFTLKGHKGEVVSVCFSADGKRLASGDHDGGVRVWDPQKGMKLLSLQGHTSPINDVSFSADGRRLASGSRDGTIKVWDAEKGRELFSLRGHTGVVLCLCFSADGRRLVSGSGDKTIKVWDARKGQELLSLKGHTDSILSVSFSADGRRLASGCVDGTIKVWDAGKGQMFLSLEGHIGRVESMTFTAEGQYLTAATFRTIKVWDSHKGRELFSREGHADVGASLCLSANGKRLASGNRDGTIKVEDAEKGRELFSLKGHKGAVYSVNICADGQRLASGGEDRVVKVWDAQKGQELLSLKGHTSPVWSVSFSADGKRLGSGSRDGTIKVWDAHKGRELFSLRGHTGDVTCLCFSADGKRLASGDEDGPIKVWDAVTGEELLSLKGHTRRVLSVSFSADGKRLASGAEDKTIKVWDARKGQELLSLKGHTNSVTSVVFSADGRQLASAGSDGTIKVWDAGKGP
jgi:WD40 repeat protein